MTEALEAPDNAAIKAKAKRAQRELAETDAAFARMRENAIAAWLASKAVDVEHREQLYRAVGVIDAVQKHLRDLVQDGEVADFAESLKAEG